MQFRLDSLFPSWWDCRLLRIKPSPGTDLRQPHLKTVYPDSLRTTMSMADAVRREYAVIDFPFRPHCRNLKVCSCSSWLFRWPSMYNCLIWSSDHGFWELVPLTDTHRLQRFGSLFLFHWMVGVFCIGWLVLALGTFWQVGGLALCSESSGIDMRYLGKKLRKKRGVEMRST